MCHLHAFFFAFFFSTSLVCSFAVFVLPVVCELEENRKKKNQNKSTWEQVNKNRQADLLYRVI